MRRKESWQTDSQFNIVKSQTALCSLCAFPSICGWFFLRWSLSTVSSARPGLRRASVGGWQQRMSWKTWNHESVQYVHRVVSLPTSLAQDHLHSIQHATRVQEGPKMCSQSSTQLTTTSASSIPSVVVVTLSRTHAHISETLHEPYLRQPCLLLLRVMHNSPPGRCIVDLASPFSRNRLAR